MDTKFDLPLDSVEDLAEFVTLNKSGAISEKYSGSKSFYVGKSKECAVVLNDENLDDLQISCHKFGSLIYFIESGLSNQLKVNGVPSSQLIIESDKRAILKVGKSWLIYTGLRNYKRKLGLSHETPEGRVGLSYKGSLPVFFHENCFIIGSHRVCDLQIPELPKFAAAVYFSPSGVQLEKMDQSVELSIDKFNIANKIQIIDNAIILMNGIRLDLHVQGDVDEQSCILFKNYKRQPGLRLIPLNEEYEIPLEMNSRLSIGRSDRCDVTIKSPELSRFHSQAMCRDRFLLLSDHNSTNGTFINKKPVKKSRAIPGDIVSFGTIDFILMYEDQFSKVNPEIY
ncbi:MAG: FHA domain-containing protein [Lentisphaerales bacterium]|nr:FHA domain-containing protein [Lentisphaerales bacterium]